MTIIRLLLLLFLIVLLSACFVAGIYYRRHREEVQDHPLYHTWIKREKLVINIYNDFYWLDGHNCQVRPEMHWTKQTKTQLTGGGYLKFIDYLKDWRYFGTKCYVKFWNLDCFDVAAWNKEHNKEEEKLNEMASYNLYDYYKSRVVERFLKGFSKLSMLNGMDSKTIGLVIIIGAGIILGIYLLMSGGI